MGTTKWRTLALATVSFNFAVLVWFSFAPFTGQLAAAFDLSLGEIGLLASAAVWLVPFGRMAAGFLTERWGATRMFAGVLVVVGGVGTLGGVGYPLVFSSLAAAGFVHAGYAAIAAVGLPVLCLLAWVSRPEVARRASVDGLLSLEAPAGHTDAPSDD